MSGYSDEEIEATLQVGAFKKWQSAQIVLWTANVMMGGILSVLGFTVLSRFLIPIGWLVMLIGLAGLYKEAKGK